MPTEQEPVGQPSAVDQFFQGAINAQKLEFAGEVFLAATRYQEVSHEAAGLEGGSQVFAAFQEDIESPIRRAQLIGRLQELHVATNAAYTQSGIMPPTFGEIFPTDTQTVAQLVATPAERSEEKSEAPKFLNLAGVRLRGFDTTARRIAGEEALKELELLGGNTLGSVHILLALLHDPEVEEMFEDEFGVGYQQMLERVRSLSQEQQPASFGNKPLRLETGLTNRLRFAVVDARGEGREEADKFDLLLAVPIWASGSASEILYDAVDFEPIAHKDISVAVFEYRQRQQQITFQE